jgi:hypothetical protein
MSDPRLDAYARRHVICAAPDLCVVLATGLVIVDAAYVELLQQLP